MASRRHPFLFLLVLFLLLAIGCGGNHSAPRPAGGSLDLAVPAGVDPALWARLTSALEDAIARYGTARRVSSVPSNPQSKVTDFALQTLTPTSATFTWSFRSQGDYDQNGEVNVSDLTPIGVNFGKTSSSPDWAKAQTADGDGNGAITISDITPIGVNLRNSLDGFAIEQSNTPTDEQSWVQVTTVPVSDGVAPQGGGFKTYSVDVASPVTNSYYRVRPYLGAGAAQTLGVASDPVATADLQPPTSVTATQGSFPDKVVVSWQAHADATGYLIFRDSQAAAVQTNDAASLSWDDTGVSDFAIHTYWVQAQYATGTSDFSLPATGWRSNHGDWWMFGHDARHSWTSAFNGPQNSDVKWATPITGAGFTTSSAAVAADGTLYVGSDLDTKLYAFNPDGSVKWSLNLTNPIESSPAIAQDGTIYVGTGYDTSTPGGVYAVYPNGTTKWSFPLSVAVYGSVALQPDGTIIAPASDGTLYAINPNGTQRWAKPLGGQVYSSPAIDLNGNIYVTVQDDFMLHVLDKDGGELWTFLADNYIDSSPTVSADGSVVYFGGNTKVYAVNTASHKQRWAIDTGSFIGMFSSAAVDGDGKVYIGAQTGELWAINPDGSKAWAAMLDNLIYSSPVIGADGLIYIASSSGHVYAFNNAGAQIWDRQLDSPIAASLAIGPDGTGYIGSSGGYFFALGPRPAVPPAQPTGLTASQGTRYQAIGLKWSLQFDADSFEIYRDGGGTPIATVGNVQTYVDTPVPDSNNHTYTVVAVNTHGSSPASTQATGFALNNAPGPGDWSMNGHDAAGTRQSGLTGPAAYNQAWQFFTLGEIHGGCAVGSNGEVYFGSNDDFVHCLDQSGTELWSFNTGGDVTGTPAVGADGTVYAGSANGNLYAINPNGTQKWAYPAGPLAIVGGPTYANGLIYFVSNNQNLVALDESMNVQWSYPLGDAAHGSPELGSDGSLYVCTVGGKLVAVDAAGGFKWAYQAGGAVDGNPCIKRGPSNDVIYFACEDMNLYAVDDTGGLKWTFPTTGLLDSSPALAADGTVYVSSHDQYLYAVKPNGTQKWSLNIFAEMSSSPAVDADGTIYVADNTGFINTATPAGAYGWYDYFGGQALTSSVSIGLGGHLFVADGVDGVMYSIGPSL